uniref:Single-pass membrane protein with aspartate rich tail 1 n=1 Tax=Molossus molossus TaxID=27622 RepID=A0A7J8G1C4_MOLMO|nr:single-pass membrane protein with aspartate rich tail 1 [Molossus molossus]
MASGAARWLLLVPVRSGVLRSRPSLKKDGDISAVRGSSGRSLVPSRSVIVTRSGAILPKPVKVMEEVQERESPNGIKKW